jgi:predicted metal-dependent hydrolase
MFGGIIKKKRRRVTTVSRGHYTMHKEEARRVILARLSHFGAIYGYSWNRVAIRDQRRRWGSCSSRKNLNFNYKLLFLPEHLRDYVIIHELCHLVEMNHGKGFWEKVSRCCPEHQKHIAELREYERTTRLEPARMMSLRSRPVSQLGLVINTKCT